MHPELPQQLELDIDAEFIYYWDTIERRFFYRHRSDGPFPDLDDIRLYWPNGSLVDKDKTARVAAAGGWLAAKDCAHPLLHKSNCPIYFDTWEDEGGQ